VGPHPHRKRHRGLDLPPLPLRDPGIADPSRQRSILITGCSSGIGYDAAHGLARRGWRVFATCRDPADVERLRAEGLESLPLDVDDPASIAEAVAEALDRTGGTLDAVFNNAAFACPGAIEDVPRDALRAILRTNVEGVHEVTRAVLPAMRRRGHGRIVNCSSVLGYVAAPWRGAYTATKYALEGLTDTLRLELRGSGIHVVTIQPGPIASDLRRKSIPHFERWVDWRASPHRDLYESRLLKRLYGGAGDRFQLPASAVTEVLVRALESPRPRARYRVTVPARAGWWLRRLAPTHALDRILVRGR
jgi:NAD(P)-dependent dehydrogenase (short-subunit alcohol dehydrogenase family)